MITTTAIIIVILTALISIGLKMVPPHVEEMKQMAIEEEVYLSEEKWRWVEIRLLFTWPVCMPFDSITNCALFRLFLSSEKEEKKKEREEAYLRRT